MEGRYIAIVMSIIIWSACYIFSLYYFHQKLTKGVKPFRPIQVGGIMRMSYIIIGIPFAASVLTGLAFRLGGALDGDGIIWGCYIEDYGFIVLALWILSLIACAIISLIVLIKPSLLGFKDRIMPIAYYFVHHLYTFFIFWVAIWLMPYFSGPLHGIGWSCL